MHEARLWTEPWRFELQDVAFDRLFVWHGEQDQNVPVAAVRRMIEKLPRCTATIYPNEGHSVYNRLEEMMAAMFSS
jgi:dipeptidyl aminopeptidase/acylaminoacyl peptidase